MNYGNGTGSNMAGAFQNQQMGQGNWGNLMNSTGSNGSEGAMNWANFVKMFGEQLGKNEEKDSSHVQGGEGSFYVPKGKGDMLKQGAQGFMTVYGMGG